MSFFQPVNLMSNAINTVDVNSKNHLIKNQTNELQTTAKIVFFLFGRSLEYWRARGDDKQPSWNFGAWKLRASEQQRALYRFVGCYFYLAGERWAQIQIFYRCRIQRDFTLLADEREMFYINGVCVCVCVSKGSF